MIRFSKTHTIHAPNSNQDLEYLFNSNLQSIDKVYIRKVAENKFRGTYDKGWQWGENIYSTIEVDKNQIILNNMSDYRATAFLSITYIISLIVLIIVVFNPEITDLVYRVIACVFLPVIFSLIHRANFLSQERKATAIYKSIIENDFPLR